MSKQTYSKRAYKYVDQIKFRYIKINFCMQLQDFIAQLKSNRIILRKGKENILFDYLLENGFNSTSSQSQQILQKTVLPDNQEEARKFFQKTFKTRQIDIKQAAMSLITIFINQRFFEVSDIIDLISFCSQGKNQQFEKLINQYGLSQQFPGDYKLLKQKISYISILLDQDFRHKKLDQLVQLIQANCQSDIQIDSSEFKIKTANDLLSIARKSRIYIKPAKLQQLFQKLKNQKESLNEQTLLQFTYQKFSSKLFDLSNKIEIEIDNKINVQFQKIGKYLFYSRFLKLQTMKKIIQDCWMNNQQKIITFINNNDITPQQFQKQFQIIRKLSNSSKNKLQKQQNQALRQLLKYIQEYFQRNSQLNNKIMVIIEKLKKIKQEFVKSIKANISFIDLIKQCFGNNIQLEKNSKIKQIGKLYENQIQQQKKLINQMIFLCKDQNQKQQSIKKIMEEFKEKSTFKRKLSGISRDKNSKTKIFASPFKKQIQDNKNNSTILDRKICSNIGENLLSKSNIFPNQPVSSRPIRRPHTYKNYPLVQNQQVNPKIVQKPDEIVQKEQYLKSVIHSQLKINHLQKIQKKKQNLFQPAYLKQYGTGIIKVLFIFLSTQKIQAINIVKNKYPCQFTLLKFVQTYIGLMSSQIQQKYLDRYQIEVTFDKYKQIKKQFVKINPNTCQQTSLTIVSNIANPYMNQRLVLNYALFQSIGFVIKNMTARQNYKINEDEMMIWMKTFYEYYQPMRNQCNQQIEKEMFYKLQILKDNYLQDYHSRYFVYLFFAIYQQNAQKLFQNYNLKNKIKFSNQIKRMDKRFSNSIGMQTFYYKNKIMSKISNQLEQKQMIQLIKQVLQNISKSQMFNILVNIVEINPQILGYSDYLIQKEFEDNQELDGFQFFWLKLKYVNLFKDHQTAIMNFIKQLLEIFTKKKINQKNKFQFSQSQLCQFLISKNKYRKLQFNIKSKLQMIRFYIKSKQLWRLSNKTINLLEPVQDAISRELQYMLKDQFVDMMISIISSPVYQHQFIILEGVISQMRIISVQVKQLIQKHLRQSWKENGKYFKTLIQTFGNKNKYFIYIQINQILQAIDNQVSIASTNLQKQKYLNQLFQIWTKKNSLTYKRYFGQLQIQINKFKKINQTRLRLKNANLKQILEDQIFQVLSLTCKKDPSLIIQKIDQIYPNWDNKNNKINEELRQIYLKTRQLNQAQIEAQIWKIIESESNTIQSIKRKYNDKFRSALAKVQKNINSDNCLADQIQGINIQRCKKIFPKQLCISLTKALQKIKNFKNSIQGTMKLFKYILSKDGQYKFKKQINDLQNYANRLNIQKLNDIYKIDNKYEQLFTQSRQICYFQQYNRMDPQKINSIEDILYNYKQTKHFITSKVAQFGTNKQFSFEQFNKYFIVPDFKQIMENCFIQKQIKQKIMKYHNLLNVQNLKNLVQYANSFQYILNLTTSANLFNINSFKIVQLMNRIQKGDLKFTVNMIYELVTELKKQINKLFGFTDQQIFEDQQSAKIFKQTYKGKELFEMMKKYKVDSQLIEDVKEYVADQQNSSLNMTTIKQLQQVTKYWNIFKETKNFKGLMHQLNKLIGEQKSELSESIRECSNNYRLIETVIDKAANRQISFKYQIDAIFLKSNFKITKDFEILITIATSAMSQNIKKSSNSQQKQLTMNFNKLLEYKNKSKLLINNYSHQQKLKNQNNNQSTGDSKIKNMIESFSSYLDFFKIIEDIQQSLQKLANYGFDSEDIAQQIQIENTKINLIQNKKKQLKQKQNNWINNIKELYSKSYLLTHFRGKQLNKFIKLCSEQQYHPCLERVINFTKKQFDNKLKADQQFKKSLQNAKIGEYINRIYNIIKAFSNLERQYLNVNRNKEYDDNKPQPYIKLLTCSAKQIYCTLFQNSNNKPKLANPSQILYCQQSTSSEQIQFFLDRALIGYEKTHFIVGVHQLKLETKINFFDILTNLKQKRLQQLKKAKLCFVGDNANDKLYALLSKPNYFHISKEQLLRQTSQKQTQKMINIIPAIKIVSSTKAGLGKTFYVEKEAQKNNKKVRYFPVCGNVKFQNIAKRLKELNLSNQQSLLIQIGHIQNKTKFEVFLAQIILFRCFYYEEYIFIPKQSTLYIEIQNIFQTSKEDCYHIINILKESKEHIHVIEQFDIKKISYDLNNYNDKFVYKYLSFHHTKQWIRNNQYSYKLDYLKQKQNLKYPENVEQLVKIYFLKWFEQKQIKPSFTIFSSYKKMLFNVFRIFSDSPYFYIQNFVDVDKQFQFLHLEQSRENFLKISSLINQKEKQTNFFDNLLSYQYFLSINYFLFEQFVRNLQCVEYRNIQQLQQYIYLFYKIKVF